LSLDRTSAGANDGFVGAVGRSSVLPTVGTLDRGGRAIPVRTYDRLPGVPPVRVLWSGGARHADGFGSLHPHAHDFLVLLYVERGGSSMRVDDREWALGTGDVFVVAPGEVVTPDEVVGAEAPEAWAVAFPPDIIEPSLPGSFLSWRAHPLLFPFVRGVAGGAQRLHVPVDDRAGISERFAALERELHERRDGYNEAVLAHLTLLLVAVSRLASDVTSDLTLRDEPMLAAVFDVIEASYHRPISLKDVASAVGLTPGHLTTIVGRKTGRTVQQWITERRMTEARRLLAETDVTVEAIGARVGYRDTSYFIKRFRRSNGSAPQEWRRAGRRG
jgi:AraC family transcriptional activator of pobA